MGWIDRAIALQTGGKDAVQDFIDHFCAAMREVSSPGHHIVVLLVACLSLITLAVVQVVVLLHLRHLCLVLALDLVRHLL